MMTGFMKFVIERKPSLPYWLVPAVGLFVVIFTVFWVRLDPDFGWHLQSGRYILQHGIPPTDIFTYTAPDFPWINHEWLSDIVIVGAYAAGGFVGVAGLFALIWTAALVLASRTVRWPVLAIAVAAMLDTITARPNAWTALFFALVLLAVRRRVYWPLIPLFALWANKHGGFIMGFLVLGVAAWHDRKYRWVLAGCLVATFLNPYGPTLYVELWRTFSDGNLRRHIVEWQPLAVGVLSGFYIVAYLVIGATTGWRRRAFILPTILLVSAISTMRQFPLFVVASLGLIDLGYGKLVDFLSVKAGWKTYLLPLLAVGIVAAPVFKIIRHPDNQSPIVQVAQLSARPCQGNLFNDYDFGGYLIWKLPQTKIYIDGRMPSWRLGDRYYLGDWMRDLSDSAARQRDFAKYNVGCVLIRPKHRQIIRELRSAGWRVTSADSQAVLLRRPD